MRKVDTITSGQYTAKIYRDVEWDEYRVTFSINNIKHPDADYHTPDIDDARGTAKHMIAHMVFIANMENPFLCIGDQLNREDGKAPPEWGRGEEV